MRPRPILISSLAIALLAIGAAVSIRTTFAKQEPRATEQGAPTVVLLVRHAEKATDEGDDPTLTAAGAARAQALAHVAQNAGVRAVYSTTLQRTRLTVLPLADALGLTVQTLAPGDIDGLVERLRTRHPGETVLVAGHSNTIPAILRALGANASEMSEKDYDDLFLAHLAATGEVTVTHLQYGVATKTEP